MSAERADTSSELQFKDCVEQAIVAIYDVAYAREIDLTPIDEAVDMIRDALGIVLVDCGKCGETVLIERAQPVSDPTTGEETRFCRLCSKEQS
jgi:formylmethanofuran dehydrogenase subunit E